MADLDAAVAYSASASFTAGGTRVVPWARVAFGTRSAFSAFVPPRGTRRRTMVTAIDGTILGQLENARHGSITWELNAPDEWTFALGALDPKVAAIVAERLREAQLWRGDRLLSWGPMTRPALDPGNGAVGGHGALWHLTRRAIGRAGRTNHLTNGDFENGTTGWHIDYTNPLEPLANRTGPGTNYTAAVSKRRAVTGTRSLRLEQTGTIRYGVTAVQSFVWTVDPALNRDGDQWTASAYCFIDDDLWAGPRDKGQGLELTRGSSTETVTITPEGGGPSRTYPRVIESAVANLDENTPRGKWVRMQVALTVPPTGVPEFVAMVLSCPRGAVFWDRATFALDESTRFVETDQAEIVAALVAHLQDPAYDKADVNLAAECPLTGVLRDRTYAHHEHLNGWDTLGEFPTLDDGLDLSCDYTPTRRILRTHYPAKGRHWPGLVLEWGRNLADYAWTSDGESAATSMIVLGQGDGAGREEGFAIDPSSFAGGITLETVFSAPPETPVDTLDNVAGAELAKVHAPEVLALKTVPVTAGLERWFAAVRVGDSVPVRVHNGALNVTGIYRLGRITLNDDDTLDLVTSYLGPEP